MEGTRRTPIAPPDRALTGSLAATSADVERSAVKIYTKKGDDGTTGLLYGGRVPKDDPRTDVYGSLDEAVAALGVARAAGLVAIVEEIVLRLQREMFVVGAQLATAPENQARLVEGVSKVDPAMTARAESDIDDLVARRPLPARFVVPGETLGSAGLDLARAVVRRAERRAVGMDREGMVADPEVMRYLNRVSDLLFVLARYEEGERGLEAPPTRES